MRSLQHYIRLKYLQRINAHVLTYIYIYVRKNVECFRMLIALPTFCGQGSDSLWTDHKYSVEGHRCFTVSNAAFPRVLRRISAEFGGLA